MKLKDDIRVRSGATVTLRGRDGSVTTRRRGPGGAPRVKTDPRVESNLTVQLIDKKGRTYQKRQSHNVFLNYGRDWLKRLVALNVGPVPFRDDRIRYIAYGIGGTNQRWDPAVIRALHPAWAGYADDWVGGAGAAGPVQTDTDPTSLALEWPVEVSAGLYYDSISIPATFPTGIGIVRFTVVAGYNEISFGIYDSVPVSEIGLFTESVPDLSVAPTEAILPLEKFGVAYHAFDPLSKTSEFVMQTDWELRFS